MTTFIVEYLKDNAPAFDSVTGSEDIDLSMFNNVQTLWVCDTQEEILAVENELRRKHATRSSQ